MKHIETKMHTIYGHKTSQCLLYFHLIRMKNVADTSKYAQKQTKVKKKARGVFQFLRRFLLKGVLVFEGSCSRFMFTLLCGNCPAKMLGNT